MMCQFLQEQDYLGRVGGTNTTRLKFTGVGNESGTAQKASEENK